MPVFVFSSAEMIFRLEQWTNSGSPRGLKVGQRFRRARLKKLRSALVNGVFPSQSGFTTDLSGNWLVRTGLFLPGGRIVITSRRLLWQDLHDRPTWWWCMLLFSSSLPLSRFLSREKVSWWCSAQTRLNLHFPLREALNYAADESSRSKNGTPERKNTERMSEVMPNTRKHVSIAAQTDHFFWFKLKVCDGFCFHYTQLGIKFLVRDTAAVGHFSQTSFITCVVKLSEAVWGENCLPSEQKTSH